MAQTAMTYQQSGRLAEAAALYEKALARAKEVLPKDDSDIGMLMGRLGAVYYESKQFDQAISQFTGSLANLRLHLRREDPNVTFVVNELARSFSAARRYEESARLNAENLKVREASLGKDHPATVLSLHNLGIDFAMMQRWPEAVQALETTLEKDKSNGAQRPFYARDLKYLGDGHKALGHWEKAEQYYLQALKVTETPPTKNSEETIFVLQGMANFYTGRQEYFSKAREYGQRATDLCRQVYGPEHYKTAESLGFQGSLPSVDGKDEEAAAMLRQCLRILRKTTSYSSPNLWTYTVNLARIDLRLGQNAEAEELALAALGRIETLLIEHDTSSELDSKAEVLARSMAIAGHREILEQRLKQFLAAVKSHTGEDNPALACAYSFTGATYLRLEALHEAQENSLRALAIQRKRLASDDLELAVTLTQLATIARAQGKYADAESYLLECLRIRRKKLGEEHYLVASSLSDLGHVYLRMHRYPEAEQNLWLAITIAEKAGLLGGSVKASATELLGTLYGEQQRLADASQMLEQSAASFKQREGETSRAYAWSLVRLAQFHSANRHFDEATQYYGQAIEIFRKTQSKGQPDHPVALSGLGIAQFELRKYEDSYQTLRQAVLSFDAQEDSSDRDRSITLDGLIQACVKTGRWDEALAHCTESRQAQRRWLGQVLPAMAPNEQLIFLFQVERVPLFISLAIALHNADKPQTAEISAEWLLNSKSLAAEYLAGQIQSAQRSSDPAAKQTLQELTTVREKLASSVLHSETESHVQHLAEEKTLYERQRDLARKLATQTKTGNAHGAWVRLADVRKAIPVGTVFIDIARFRVLDFDVPNHIAPAKPPHYVAWVIPAAAAGDVRMVDLGEAAPIDAAVAKSRLAALAYPRAVDRLGLRGAVELSNRFSKQLTDLVYKPLSSAIGSASTLLVSPDGGLWLYPWEALPMGDGKFLVEQKQISYVVSGRALVDAAPRVTGSGAVLFADPDYNAMPSSAAGDSFGGWVAFARQSLGASGDAGLLAGARFLPLAGRSALVDALVPPLQEYLKISPVVYRGKQAEESTFKALHGPRMLILSTHGYFLPDQLFDNLPLTKEGRRAWDAVNFNRRFGSGSKAFPFVPEPLLRCGLALAGANNHYKAHDANDGILTGLEILGADLRGTDLVVLDACESGVGAVRDGEGTVGLHQAFQLAGARAVVASMWVIPVLPANRIMAAFVTNLSQRQSIASSLRNAQLASIEKLRAATGVAHPARWAGFTVTGDCRWDAGDALTASATTAAVAKSAVPPDPYAAAAEALRLSQYDEAAIAYTEAIRLSPKHGLAFYGRGLANAAMWNFDRAIADHSRAIELRPDFGLAYWQRGESYLQGKQVEKALSDFNAAIRLVPKSPTIRLARARAFRQKKDYDQALTDCEQALQLEPNSIKALELRSDLHQRQGQYAKSIADNTEIIRIAPASVSGYLGRAFDYLKLHEFDKALDDCNQAAQLNPQNSEIYWMRAEVYRAKGETQKADADLKRSTRLVREQGL